MKQKTYRYHSLGFLCLLLSPGGIQAESPPHPPTSKEQAAQTTSQLPATSLEAVHKNQPKPEPESSVSKQPKPPHEEETQSKTPFHPQVSETLSSKEPLNQGNPKVPQSPPPQASKEDNNKAETLSSKEPLNQGNPEVPRSPPPQASKENNNKAELDKFLGEMKPILTEAQKVEAYLVGPELADADVQERSKLADYPVLKGPVVLIESQVKMFQTLILDEKSYFWGPAKKCLLRPTTALRFIKGKMEVVLLFSTYCDLWSFYYKGNLQTQDYSPVREKMNEFLTPLFPKEPPVQNP